MPLPLYPDILVTLLAQERWLLVQQRFMIGSVHTMTMAAVLAHRVMLPQERPTDLGMAFIAIFINAEFVKAGWTG